MELTYTPVGDYLLPDLALSTPPEELAEPLGRYARMRRAFLREHRPVLYNTLLLTENLFPHLREIDEAAARRLAQAPRKCRMQIEEIIFLTLVYKYASIQVKRPQREVLSCDLQKSRTY